MDSNSIVLVPCTDRKRLQVDPLLQARNLTFGPVHDVADQWAKRVESAHERIAARDLYRGRGVQEGLRAASLCNARMVFLSAGLGLVAGEELIPAYGLTVTRGKPDSILSKIADASVTPARWWRVLGLALNRRHSLKDLLPAEAGSLALFCLSEAYAALIVPELEKLPSEHLSQIRLFGFGLERHVPEKLSPQVMPIDDRLDGPDSRLPGTRSDFAQRASRFYAELLNAGEVRGESANEDASVLRRRLEAWRRPDVPKRQLQTDAEILAFIERNWEAQRGRSGAMLRHLRDSGFACEQSRFKDLFKQAAGRIDASSQSALL